MHKELPWYLQESGILNTNNMYKALRSVLFLLPPERAHYTAMLLLQFGLAIPGIRQIIQRVYKPKKAKPFQLLGLTFPNRVGLAAGFDKDARWLHLEKALGFGFVEVGTVTPLPQPGNEKPRLFRLKQDWALINRMGFNNRGAHAMAKKLQRRPGGMVVGGNIGKNKNTPNEEATEDYLKAFDAIYPFVDYLVVNVSSPNTPGLRALQEKESLMEILGALTDARKTHSKAKPILLKIAPDLTEEQLKEITEVLQESGIDGVIATNTTISREHLQTPSETLAAIGAGGLSGKPVKSRSTEVIRYLRQQMGPDFPIIGVGGIFSAEDAQEKLDAGAQLVQIYTGFIYEGPGVVKEIAEAI